PKLSKWNESAFPLNLAPGKYGNIDSHFGIFGNDGFATLLHSTFALPDLRSHRAWHFGGQRWNEDKEFFDIPEVSSRPVYNSWGVDEGFRLRDIDRDGICELIVGTPFLSAIFKRNVAENRWVKLPYALPRGTSIIDRDGRDAGLRFVDVNQDGYDDVVFSDANSFAIYQFVPKANPRLSWEVGWNDEIVVGKRGHPNEIPMIVRGGTNRNNGVWFHSQHMWVQNEDTASLPNVVDRRSFKQLLTADQPPP